MMKFQKAKVVKSIFLSIALTLSVVTTSYAAEYEAMANRFSIAVVLDASNSMNYTDPEGLRYEAVRQFTSLLAEEGNYVSSVVFSNHVVAQEGLQHINSQEDKDGVTENLMSVMSTGVNESMGYTNIGEGLSTAVNMLNASTQNDLPKVILLLSDGNTEMPNEEEYQNSLNIKAEAIASAQQNNITIYSVCLNQNGSADVSEMEQISSATEGVFEEVSVPEDLQSVFNSFYSLIYGTSTIVLTDDTFPENGTLTSEFVVPGLGVEEVNIIINGATSGITITTPSSNETEGAMVVADTFTSIKLTELEAGTWKMVTTGVAGDQIKINMIYNTDLGLAVETNLSGNALQSEEELVVYATLTSGEIIATQDAQYEGYEGELQLLNANDTILKTVQMTVVDGRFIATVSGLEAGEYYIRVYANGYQLNRFSDVIGPITVNALAVEPENQAPVAVEPSITKRAYILPFVGGSVKMDLSELATDADDETLRYEIASARFSEGAEYTIENDALVLSLTNAEDCTFDVIAYDAKGQSCTIAVAVTCLNMGWIALIALGVAVVVVLIVLYQKSNQTFGGTITVRSNVHGASRSDSFTPRKGRCKLTRFDLDSIGIDYSKSYFRATGGAYVELYVNTPVVEHGKKKKKVRIAHGIETCIAVDQNSNDCLYIRFDSLRGNLGGRPRRTGARR